MFLKAGADPNAAAEDGSTPLMVAAQYGHSEVLQLLLEAGADKNAAKTNGVTALLVAAQNGHVESLWLLLEAGADKHSAKEHDAGFVGCSLAWTLRSGAAVAGAGADIIAAKQNVVSSSSVCCS